jgi:type IV fimbrial biogenesis protein FimT
MSARGFTLIELLTAIAILAIAVGFIGPGLARLFASNAATATLNEFTATLQLARAEAVRRGTEVVVCKSPDGHTCVTGGGWDQGWLVFSDPDGVRACADGNGDLRCDGHRGRRLRVGRPAAHERFRIDGGGGNTGTRVVYDSLGRNSGYWGTFTICDRQRVLEPRGLSIARGGRLRVRRDDDLSCDP